MSKIHIMLESRDFRDPGIFKNPIPKSRDYNFCPGLNALIPVLKKPSIRKQNRPSIRIPKCPHGILSIRRQKSAKAEVSFRIESVLKTDCISTIDSSVFRGAISVFESRRNFLHWVMTHFHLISKTGILTLSWRHH